MLTSSAAHPGGGGATSAPTTPVALPPDEESCSALLALLRTARGAFDRRLQLRLNAGKHGDLNIVRIITVSSWSDDPKMGFSRALTFTATQSVGSDTI